MSDWGGRERLGLSCVNEGDVKLILINVEGRGTAEREPSHIGFLFLLCINDCGGAAGKRSNADKAGVCSASPSEHPPL